MNATEDHRAAWRLLGHRLCPVLDVGPLFFLSPWAAARAELTVTHSLQLACEKLGLFRILSSVPLLSPDASGKKKVAGRGQKMA